MNKKAIMALAACASSLVLAQGGWASIVEHAIDTTGLSEPITITYGAHTTNAAISPGVDVDGYRFNGVAGDALRVVVSGHTHFFDPLIELRDPAGTVLQTQTCTGSLTCAVSLDQTLASTGVHFLNISDSGNNEAGNYTLHIDRFPSPDNWTPIAYDSPISTDLGHAGDHDFFAFAGAAGTGVRINLAGQSHFLDPSLQIWDPSGALIFNNFCPGSLTCSISADLALIQSGLYRMSISDSGLDETGNYSVNLSCSFGTCAPNPVPIPAAAPLFATGLISLVAGLRRRSGKTIHP
ncbi:MAG: hypothetical protein NNA30_05330 [Nitrospira sp.]|nr:hypothetical protein [Nitrospira sp.]